MNLLYRLRTFILTRLFYILCFGLLTSALSLTSSATTLTVSDNIIISEVDNKVIEHGFIGKKSTFTLKQGEHAVVVRYKDVFEDLDFAEDRVVESQNFVVKFTLAKEQQVKLTTTKIKNLSQAERFAKAPELNLVDEDNKQLVLELVDVADYKLARQVNIAVSSLATQTASHSAVLPAEVKSSAQAKQASATLQQKMTTSSNTLAQVDSLTMLKYWWQTASNTEKDQFKQFLINK